MKTNFPADSDGNVCGYDLPAYPYVYFVNPPNKVKYFDKIRVNVFALRNAQALKISNCNVYLLKILVVDIVLLQIFK